MNAIDWFRVSAETMYAQRPDAYADVDAALRCLYDSVETLREVQDQPVASSMFASFILTRICDEGVEEFILSSKLTGLFVDVEEESVWAYSFDETISDLPHILDDGEILDDDEWNDVE